MRTMSGILASRFPVLEPDEKRAEVAFGDLLTQLNKIPSAQHRK